MSIKSKIQSLVAAANTATGESDANLTDAVQTLVDGYGQGGATVDDLCRDAWPSGDITLTVCPTRAQAFSFCKKIQKVTATYSTGRPGMNVFQGSSITEFVGINVAQIETSMFFQCGSLVKVTAPKSNFYNYQAFGGSTKLEVVDLGSGAINRGAVFINCYKLQTMILRSSSLCALGGSNDLQNTPFRGYGGLTGTLYVPAALVQQYKEATNWSALYNNGTMDVQPIEGSIYETQYADGTPIA